MHGSMELLTKYITFVFALFIFYDVTNLEIIDFSKCLSYEVFVNNIENASFAYIFYLFICIKFQIIKMTLRTPQLLHVLDIIRNTLIYLQLRWKSVFLITYYILKHLIHRSTFKGVDTFYIDNIT